MSKKVQNGSNHSIFRKRFLSTGHRISSHLYIFMPDIWRVKITGLCSTSSLSCHWLLWLPASLSVAFETQNFVLPFATKVCFQLYIVTMLKEAINRIVIGYTVAPKLSRHWLLFGSQTGLSLVTIRLSNLPVIGWRSPYPEDERPGGQQKEHNICSWKRRPFTSTPCDYLRKKSERILTFWQKRTFRWVMRKWVEEEEMREYLFAFYPFYNLIQCYYKTVDFATAASQNGVSITQGKCHKMS